MQEPNTDLLSRIIAEHMSEGIVLMDAQGHVVWVNPAFTRISGYGLDDLQGKRLADVLEGLATTQESKGTLAHAIATQTRCTLDVVNYSKAGQAYISEINISPITDNDGSLTHYVAVQRDVSEERTLKQKSIDFNAYQRALDLQAIV